MASKHEIYREVSGQGNNNIFSDQDVNNFQSYELYLWLGLMGLVLSCVVGYCELFMERKIIKNIKWKSDNENNNNSLDENQVQIEIEDDVPKLEPILDGKV